MCVVPNDLVMNIIILQQMLEGRRYLASKLGLADHSPVKLITPGIETNSSSSLPFRMILSDPQLFPPEHVTSWFWLRVR